VVRNQRDEGKSVYTQTYSTADRTVSNATAGSLGDLEATNGGWGAASEVQFDAITTRVDQLIADDLAIRKLINALIDDLQEAGIIK